MTAENLTANLHLLTPEFVLAGFALLVFVLDLLLSDEHKDLLGWLSALGLIGLAVLSVLMLVGENESLYNGLLAVDAYSLFFKVFFCGIGVFIILSSIDYVKKYLNHPGEFYGLLLFSILGMNLMAMSRELLTAYISLELLSFSLYVMVAYALGNPRSNEGSLKYIIIGALSSAILLYGLSMVYSTLGVTRFDAIAEALAQAGDVSPALWAGLALIVAGLGFKLAAVPFHMWAPDAYEGAPLPVTAYLAIASKAAAFALVLRLLAEAFVPAGDRWDQWQIIIVVLAALSMLVGNLVALGAAQPETVDGLLQRGARRLYPGRHCGTGAGLAAGGERGDLLPGGLLGYQHGCVCGIDCLLQRNRTGRNPGPGRPGGPAAFPGNGYCHWVVLPEWTAYLRRVHHQVLPLHGGGKRRVLVAGGAGHFDEPDFALLLPASHPADVHPAGAGRVCYGGWRRVGRWAPRGRTGRGC